MQSKISPRQRRIRIIATLGPASQDAAMIEKLFDAGVDVFRLNMSHGDHSDKKDIVRHIRKLEQDKARPIAIMADLQGPKLRIGLFEKGPVILQTGADFTLDLMDRPGDQNRAQLPHREIFAALEPGADLLVNDGKIRLRVRKIQPDNAICEVIIGGELSDRKGVNVPGVVLPIPALTDKDRSDLDFALSLHVEWIALSFVQRPEDVAEARKIIGSRASVIAKIEKPAALERIDEIIELADGIMVARGDLGVEMPVEDVPGIQKQLIRKARRTGKAVIVATQMLESMISSPMPTRAEVSDVATAVADGADAVMLSAESAAGDFPVEAVRVMNKVAIKVESDPAYSRADIEQRAEPNATAEDAITAAARQVGRTIDAAAIVTFTTSGSTALRASRERPRSPILVMTPNLQVARRLCLFWGLHTVKTRDAENFEEMIGKARRMALRQGLAKAGDRIVITAGVPFGTPGATNVLHIAWVSDDELKD